LANEIGLFSDVQEGVSERVHQPLAGDLVFAAHFGQASEVERWAKTQGMSWINHMTGHVRL
jgi:hypothetical protein